MLPVDSFDTARGLCQHDLPPEISFEQFLHGDAVYKRRLSGDRIAFSGEDQGRNTISVLPDQRENAFDKLEIVRLDEQDVQVVCLQRFLQ